MVKYESVYGWEILFLITILFIVGFGKVSGQFVEHFDDRDVNQWNAFTGDGEAQITLTPKDDHATIRVDATNDRYNIWWAVINRSVNEGLDLSRLEKKNHKLRLEVKVRASHAPRRVNLHMFRQNDAEHHKNLMEYDIPDTTNWHTLSLTAKDLNLHPGDSVFAQLALIDWGTEIFELDVDYFKVTVVDTDKAGPDLGTPLQYRPEVPDLKTYDNKIPVAHDATVDLLFPESTLDSWKSKDSQDTISVMTVNSSHRAIMRWNLDSFKGVDIKGWSVLELTPQSAWTNENYVHEELGQIRVSEVIDGDPNWQEQSVSWSSFSEGKPANKVINPQMILDVEVSPEANKKIYITIPEPVMQRLINGKSYGLAMQPLGPVQASFYDSQNNVEGYTPKLFFNAE